MFDILPAIDVRGGLVVRLSQGDFRRETVYGTDPVEAAASFAAQGARWLHVVDLDAARARGGVVNRASVARIVDAVGDRVGVEVAGGIRDATAAAAALEAGARRIVVGTAALRDPGFAGTLVRRHSPERVAVALDVRDGRAVGEGWRDGAPGVPVRDALAALASEGVETFEVTAIDRDGLLGGPDLRLLQGLVELDCGVVIASGGVAELADLEAVRAIGCRGAIVGRALYEGRLDLAAALTRFEGDRAVGSE